MGCSTSSQTAAVDTSRPTAKAEESNGASATGASNENGNVPEDSETIPDQTPTQAAAVAQPAGEVVASADSAATTAVPPAEEEESQRPTATPAAQSAEENPGLPDDAAAAAAAQTVAESSEEPAATPADGQEAAASDPQTNTDEKTSPQ